MINNEFQAPEPYRQNAKTPEGVNPVQQWTIHSLTVAFSVTKSSEPSSLSQAPLVSDIQIERFLYRLLPLIQHYS